MCKLRNDQYFFLIFEINLFPQVEKKTVKMLEQVMNAILLSNRENIQFAINNVILLEQSTKKLIKQDYVVVLKQIEPLLKKLNIGIARGDEVTKAHLLYHKKKYYWDVGKQAVINMEFKLEKKITYDGKRIIWEQTYIDWIDEILRENRAKREYNVNDELIYRIIEPKTYETFIEAQDVILNETEKYAQTYRQNLELSKQNAH